MSIGSFGRLSSCKIAVLGDLLLDAYTIGKAKRISPEAPVAIVHVLQEKMLPGGSGNVLLNLVALGAEVIALGRVGDDLAGDRLLKELAQEGVDLRGVFRQQDFPTPVKNRIIAENQQVVRIDHEKVLPLDPEVEERLIQILPDLLEDVSLLALSDYGKGLLTPKLTQAAIAFARTKKIPVIADPKGIDFSKYLGSHVIKPNLQEAYAAAKLSLDAPLENVAEKILKDVQADVLMITRSEAGISLFYPEKPREDFTTKIREVKDVTGAGDTVLAMLAFCLANGLTASQAAEFCNIAASIAIEKFGCAKITLSQFARRLLEIHTENKVFGDHHIFVLKEALKKRDYIVLNLYQNEGLSSETFSHIQSLANQDNVDLLIHILDRNPKKEFVAMLASLNEVKFILQDSQDLQALCSAIKPKGIFLSDGKNPLIAC